MSVYIVSCNLTRPKENYSGLTKAIGAYKHAEAVPATYLIDTTRTCAELRDTLSQHIDEDDQLFVMRVRGAWAAARDDAARDWLRSRDRTWG
ncbi:MAG: hypothetical protein DI556_09980 [Rhodovulum sulfidophilum]|uniref:Uncharacterized protein n=1 Tax=Rhodovulum sulfidophilum TaxID=35806 RepID=A0A2W5NC31_RHOSU|nr:MAG: hypothetical protein DI556_09980 [Rhodovulum sulfidophilum]